MNAAKLPANVNSQTLSKMKPVLEIQTQVKEKKEEKPENIEFKMTPSVDKITRQEPSLTGTYNNQGKLGVISNKVIVFVQPSAFIRDKLVPSYLQPQV